MSDLNDPRVFFAAERTLLAWNRTSLTLMAFGFMIERFNLFTHMLAQHPGAALEKNFSYWIGLSFILLGAIAAAVSALQYKRLLPSFKPTEIPDSYRVGLGIFMNLIIALLGTVLTLHLYIQGPV